MLRFVLANLLFPTRNCFSQIFLFTGLTMLQSPWCSLMLFAVPAPGNFQALEVDSRQTATRTINGQVVDADGKPAAGCTVELYCYGNKDLKQANVDELGQFSFSIDEKIRSLMVRAMSPDKTLQAIQRRDVMDPDQLDEPIRARLEPTLSTTVTVMHLGKPVANAMVAGLAKPFYPAIQGRTGIDGKLTLSNPVSYPLESIWVVDKSRGVAFWYPTVEADTVQRARENQPGEVTLELLPTRTCAVKVVDVEGNPVAGVEIFPYFRIEQDSNRKFFPKLPETFATTGASGIAKFDWMPAEPVNWFIPTLVSEEYRTIKDRYSNEDIRAAKKTLKVGPVPKKFPIIGKLVSQNNPNLKGVHIVGCGPGAGPFTVKCDEDGTFRFDALPRVPYSLVAMDSNWASDVVTGELVDADGKQIGDLALSLYPATTVTATVTRNKDRVPVVRGDMLVEQNISVVFQDPELGTSNWGNALRKYVTLSDKGEITVGLGRGKWSLMARSGKWLETKEIEIKDGAPVQIQFHSDWMGENTIAGRMNLPENGEKIPNPDDAIVTVIDHNYRSETFETKPDAQGNWSLNADVQATFAVLAFARNGNFGTLKIVKAPDELPVSLQLVPTTSIAGTLVDDTGYPVANREIVLIYEINTRSRVRFGATKTNDDGEFLLTGVITSMPLSVACMRDSLNHVIVKEKAVYEADAAVKGLRIILSEK